MDEDELETTSIDCDALLDLVTELGYKLAMSGAETYRVEESANRIMACYGMTAEAYSIPNSFTVSLTTPEGKVMTRMRRVGYHGTNLDEVERYSNLSRRICTETPEISKAQEWLTIAKSTHASYRFLLVLLGNFLGACGFCVFYSGTWVDFICAGICGAFGGLVSHYLSRLQTNSFFRTIIVAFLMAMPAYAFGAVGIAQNPDSVVIGALMLLVPGLLFTNSMRDLIFGDTSSGLVRMVQVFLVAGALALGTGVAWKLGVFLWGEPVALGAPTYSYLVKGISCLIACLGFVIIFNIHGLGALISSIGGVCTWIVYVLVRDNTGAAIWGFFLAAVFAAVFAEVMARVRKAPAISYLVISILPLLPGAHIYYTMQYCLYNEVDAAVSEGMYTVSIALALALGILMVSTVARLVSMARRKLA